MDSSAERSTTNADDVGELQRARREIRALNGTIGQLRGEIDALQGLLRESQATLAVRTGQIIAMRNSRSWQATAFIRAALRRRTNR